MRRYFMWLQPLSLARLLVGIAVLGFAVGCGKKEAVVEKSPGEQGVSSAPVDVATIAGRSVFNLHWLGKSRLMEVTNADYQTAIWKMPESQRLETQTLDKLAANLPKFLGLTMTGDTNTAMGLLRPLLDDIVQAESFVEIRVATNGAASEVIWALRLATERVAVWQTNINALSQAIIAGGLESGSLFKAGIRVELVKDWTVVRVSADDTATANRAAQFVQMATQPGDTNQFWVDLQADLRWWLASNSILPAEHLPELHLTLHGEGQKVRTRGELDFANPLPLPLEPWNIPTNLVHDPLVSFTAARGIGPWLETSPWWREKVKSGPPTQAFIWAMQSSLFQTYFAAPLPNSSNYISELGDQLTNAANSYLTTNGWGKLVRSNGVNGVFWVDVPLFQPFLQHEINPVQELVTAGFFLPMRTGSPMPPDLISQLIGQTNLVYYDWELSTERIGGWFYLGQALRLIAGREQLGVASAGLKWLQAISLRLGNTATTLQSSSPGKLTLTRTSSAGLTAFELQLLVDWLESPGFPEGLNSALKSNALNARRKTPKPTPPNP